MKRKELILNPFFIAGLVVLLLNDFYLKYEFGNFITGKLSDFAGLLIFPMFIASIIPQSKKFISIIIGLGFIIWKQPLFTPIIDLINQISFISIHRTIDYSDYMALLILPLSHYLINYKEKPILIKTERLKSFSKFALSGIAFFAFCATSMIFKEIPQGLKYVGLTALIHFRDEFIFHQSMRIKG